MAGACPGQFVINFGAFTSFIRHLSRQDIQLTVLLKSIRQSRVTGVLDVTNFGTLSRVTEALDEYTLRHGRFKIWVQGCSEQISLAADTLPTIFSSFSRFLASNLTNIALQTKFNRSSTVKNEKIPFQQI
jgi:hypothetical protein